MFTLHIQKTENNMFTLQIQNKSRRSKFNSTDNFLNDVLQRKLRTLTLILGEKRNVSSIWDRYP